MNISDKILPFKNPLWLLVLSFLFLLLIPKAAWGDMLTPMMQVSRIQMLYGNILLGIIEGFLIVLLFKANIGKAIGIMILANYVSMIAGAIFHQSLENLLWASLLQNADIYNFRNLILFSIILFWAITIVLEWPFCLWILRGRKEIVRCSIDAVFLSQTLSYIILVSFYFWIGSFGNNTIQLDRSLSFVEGYPARIYYIDPEDGDIYRIRIDGSNREKVLAADIEDDSRSRLYVRKDAPESNWDLCCTDRNTNNGLTLLSNFSDAPVSQWNTETYTEEEWERFAQKYGRFYRGYYTDSEEQDTFYNNGPAADLRSENQRIWEVGTGDFVKVHAMIVENTQTGEEIKIAYDMPFLGYWMSRNATVLPGEIVVYQLEDQIIVLDLEKKKMGLLTRGLGPLVVIEGEKIALDKALENISPKEAANYIDLRLRQSFMMSAVNNPKKASALEEQAKQIFDYFRKERNRSKGRGSGALIPFSSIRFESLANIFDDPQVNPTVHHLLLTKLKQEHPQQYERVIEELERRRVGSWEENK